MGCVYFSQIPIFREPDSPFFSAFTTFFGCRKLYYLKFINSTMSQNQGIENQPKSNKHHLHSNSTFHANNERLTWEDPDMRRIISDAWLQVISILTFPFPFIKLNTIHGNIFRYLCIHHALHISIRPYPSIDRLTQFR